MKKLLYYLLIILVPILSCTNAEAFILNGGSTVATNCTGYTPPLDTTSGAVGAYSFRLLKSSYSGGNVVTIQRSSDSTQKTFTASIPSCTIDTSDAFFDGSTYTIVTWYDQSGNAANVTQATNANRPTVTLNCLNSHPCGVYSSASSQKLAGSLASGATSITYAAVVEITSQSASHSIIAIGDSSNGSGLLYSAASSACVAERVAASILKGTKVCSNSTWYRWVGTLNTNLSSIYLNGSIGADNTATQALVSETAMQIGSGFTVFMQGDIAEMIVFAPGLSISDSNTVSSNQGSYWGL